MRIWDCVLYPQSLERHAWERKEGSSSSTWCCPEGTGSVSCTADTRLQERIPGRSVWIPGRASTFRRTSIWSHWTSGTATHHARILVLKRNARALCASTRPSTPSETGRSAAERSQRRPPLGDAASRASCSRMPMTVLSVSCSLPAKGAPYSTAPTSRHQCGINRTPVPRSSSAPTAERST